MAVSLYFGLPGCGKTTMLTKLALDAVCSGNYTNVYSNVGLNIPGVTYIDNSVIGQYELKDCLVLIDEATLFADSRDFKQFSKSRMEYFLTHRHRHSDIALFTQKWDAVDIKIRTITDRVYYLKKGLILGKWITTCMRVPYGIVFPDPKTGGDKLGEIIQGYMKPPLLARLFAKRIYRPHYYPYFDSWEVEEFEPLPSEYKAVPGSVILANMLDRRTWLPYFAFRSVKLYRFGRRMRWIRRGQAVKTRTVAAYNAICDRLASI